MNIFTKIKFIFRRPKVIVVTGRGRKCAKEAIFQVLNQYPQAGKNVLLSESDLKDTQGVKGLKFLVNKSSLFILVVSHIGDIPPDPVRNIPLGKDINNSCDWISYPAGVSNGADKDFLAPLETNKFLMGFAGDKAAVEGIRELVKMIPAGGWLVLNFDDETVRKIADIANLKTLTFGFRQGADFQASDINLNGGTNFKINYKGNIVPVWLEGVFGKEQIYSALSTACVGTIFDLNLVEISQALKNYRSTLEKRTNLGT